MQGEWTIDNLENIETQNEPLNQFIMVGFDAMRQFQIIIFNINELYNIMLRLDYH